MGSILRSRRDLSSRINGVRMTIVRPAAFIIAAIALIAVLWSVFKPQRGEPLASISPTALSVPAATQAHAATERPTLPSPATHDRTFELGIKNGKLVSGPALLQVHEGDEVILDIAADRSDELHVHGYDLRTRINADHVSRL